MKKIEINSNENIKSTILIKEGITNELINILPDFINNNHYFLITNTKIAKLYPKILYKFDSKKTIIIKDGEKYKNFSTFQKIINFLLAKKIERNDTIVALGGGVVGDIAAFCASCILRGVNLIQIPTTLLAMCDSSIGGKTGINSNYGKNLIGSFYNASLVLIDTAFLETLPEYEYKCGLGEILKYAFIEKSCKNKEVFNLLEYFNKNQTDDIRFDIENTIEKCVRLKVNVVELDRKENGLRKILNYGHTFAHPIETLAKYKDISHGQAVAYGILYSSKLANNLKLIDNDYFENIKFLLNKFKLIDKTLKYQPKDIINLMKHDKKVKDGKVNLLLPTSPAVVELFGDIDQPSLEASLL